MDGEKTVGESADNGDQVLEADEVKSGDNVDNANETISHDLTTAGNGDSVEQGEENNVNNESVGEDDGKGVNGGQTDNNAQLEVPKSIPDAKENNAENNSDNASSHEGSNESTSPIKSTSPKKAKRRAIFVSYAPEASFIEKRFISYTIKELKNIGFCDDIWFDKDDGVPMESPFCFQHRLEIAEKCRASIMFLSESYFNSRVCRHEGRILLNRDEESESANADNNEEVEKPVKLFCMKYSLGKLPQEYKQLEDRVLDLSHHVASSVAELSSVVVGAFSEALEKYAPLYGLRIPSPPSEPNNLKLDRQKPASSWNVPDVQAWLTSLKMQVHCALSFEENEIDGYLLVSMSETDMESHLNVDSRVARRKLVQQVKKIQEDQALLKESWYLKCKKSKVKDDSVYVICDPNDVRFYQNLQVDLAQKNLQVKLEFSISAFNCHAIVLYINLINMSMVCFWHNVGYKYRSLNSLDRLIHCFFVN